MLGVMVVPSVAYVVLCQTIPESPRWLMGKGQCDAALAVFQDISPELAPAEVQALAAAVEESLRTEAAEDAAAASAPNFFRPELRRSHSLAFFVAFLTR